MLNFLPKWGKTCELMVSVCLLLVRAKKPEQEWRNALVGDYISGVMA